MTAGAAESTSRVRRRQSSEEVLQRKVLELARLFAWRSYHTWSSLHSAAGFPDLTLVRGERLIFAELKSEKGKLTLGQVAWLAALSRVPGVETYVWRPSDLEQIAGVLR